MSRKRETEYANTKVILRGEYGEDKDFQIIAHVSDELEYEDNGREQPSGYVSTGDLLEIEFEEFDRTKGFDLDKWLEESDLHKIENVTYNNTTIDDRVLQEIAYIKIESLDLEGEDTMEVEIEVNKDEIKRAEKYVEIAKNNDDINKDIEAISKILEKNIYETEGFQKNLRVNYSKIIKRELKRSTGKDLHSLLANSDKKNNEDFFKSATAAYQDHIKQLGLPETDSLHLENFFNKNNKIKEANKVLKEEVNKINKDIRTKAFNEKHGKKEEGSCKGPRIG